MVEAEEGDVLTVGIVDTQFTALVQGGDMRHGVYEGLLAKLALSTLTSAREGCVPSTGGCSGQEEEGHTNNGAGASHCQLRWSWTGLTRKLIRCCK